MQNEGPKTTKGLVLASPRLQVATFCLQLVILVVILLHLFAAWQYKAKWQNLSERVQRLEAALSSVPSEITKPKQQR